MRRNATIATRTKSRYIYLFASCQQLSFEQDYEEDYEEEFEEASC
jgi:hypothetical protein